MKIILLLILQEDGWPLGLQPLNMRVGLLRNRDLNGSLSFNTLLTGSPISSTDSSSDLDTQSTASFFHDKSITLGSLIGISSILEFSRRSIRDKVTETIREKKGNKSRAWLFSLCPKLSTDAVTVSTNKAPSLGYFLQAERQARKNQSPEFYGPDDDFSQALPASVPNSLFIEGHVAPPPPSPPNSSCRSCLDAERGFKEGLVQDHVNGTPLLLSCLCGNLTQ